MVVSLLLLLGALSPPKQPRRQQARPAPRPSRKPTPAEREAAQRIAKHARARNWRAALDVLRGLESANAVHFNAAIDACGKGGRWEEALSLLREMGSAGVRPDAFSFSSAISAQAKAPDGWRRALALLRLMHMLGLDPSRRGRSSSP